MESEGEEMRTWFMSKNHGIWAHIFWTAAIFVVGVSVTSFFVQGALTLKDTVFAGNFAGNVDSSAAGNKIATNVSDENRLLGSDDEDTMAGARAEAPNSADSSVSGTQYTLSGTDTLPRVTSDAYLAADLNTGEIIIESNEDLVAPIASVSKLMTALIAKEQMDLQKVVIVSRDAYNTYGYQGSLALGEKIRLYDLMYPLLMESSNDGAEVFADSYEKGHDAFMAEMNKKAQALGMKDTYYEDPSGLNPKNVSSVEDLLKLARYVHKNQPELYDITRVRQYTILKHTWKNANRFLNYDTFLGGKNGFIDEAKKTTVSMFNVQMLRGGNRAVVIVLLKSDDREGDAVKIMNFLKRNAYFDAI